MIFRWLRKWFWHKPKIKIYRFVSETTGEECEVVIEEDRSCSDSRKRH